MLSVVMDEVKATDKQLKKLAGKQLVCSRMMSVPAVGPLTALDFVAAIDSCVGLSRRTRPGRISASPG